MDFWIEVHAASVLSAGRRTAGVQDPRQSARFSNSAVAIRRAQQFLEDVASAARAAGLGELLIGSGAVGPSRIPPDHWMAPLFDFTNEYMDVPPLPNQEAEYPYEKLAEFHAQWRSGHTEDAIPSVPFLGAGWNPRPWGDPRPAFQLPDRRQWKAASRSVKTDLDSRPSSAFRLPDGKLQPAVTIYCWNEFGEGGIVAPTQGDQYMKLEVIREVFGTAGQ